MSRKYRVIIQIDDCITTKFTVEADSKDVAEELALDECYSAGLLPHTEIEVKLLEVQVLDHAQED